MNPMHQLTRRPVKAAFGALLLALAGVILALSGGQFWAAARTRAGVEATYTTVAVVTGGAEQAGDSDASLESASAAWEAARFLEQPEQQNWSIIRSAQGGPGQRVQPRPETAAGSVQFPQLQW